MPSKNGGLDMQWTTMPIVVPKDKSRTQQTDFGLRVVKTDGNTESRAGAKMSHECMTHDYAGGHH